MIGSPFSHKLAVQERYYSFQSNTNLAVQGAIQSALPSAATWLFNKPIKDFSQPRSQLFRVPNNWFFIHSFSHILAVPERY